MKINLCAPFLDPSGYGEFARFFAYALCNGGADLSCENIVLPSSSNKPIDFGIKGSVVKSKMTLVPRIHDVNIIFMIPPLFKAFRRKQAKFNIGFTMFEASLLPTGWAAACNEMDAIFVPSEWSKDSFIKSGVTKPIHVVPPGIVADEVSIDDGIKKDPVFTFYSIFQWSERKNPINLLKAYFVAMQNKPNVRLALKTYQDTRLDKNKEMIGLEVEKLKKELKLPTYPEVLLITNFLSNKEIKKLHLSSHCFVTPHRAEGWHMPAMDAMAMGNAVIATNYSGNTQYMDSSNSLLLPYFTTPCVNTGGFAPFFNGTMRWAEPSVEDLITKMQYVYDNRDECMKLGNQARQHILDKFNENSASKSIRTAIQAVIDARSK